MVRRRTPEPQAPIKKEWTLAEIERGVQKLTKRIAELNELMTGDRNAPAVAVFEAELPNTIEDIFGVGSREATSYERFRIASPMVWNSNDPDYVIDAQFDDAFRRGVKEKAALIQGLIDRLKEIREDFRKCTKCDFTFRNLDYCTNCGVPLVSLDYDPDSPTLR